MKRYYRGAALIAAGITMAFLSAGCFLETAQARKSDSGDRYKSERTKASNASDELIFDEDKEDLYRDDYRKNVKAERKTSAYDRYSDERQGEDRYNNGRETDERISQEQDRYAKKKISRKYEAEDIEDAESKAYQKERFYQTGLASWYGREFHGKKTASGEKFDMYEQTAAHKTLPFGTIVEVKNIDNGKSVKVKINDRGPYRGERIIDLSYDAAKEIGLISKGEALVGINIVGKASVKKDKKRTKNIEPVVDETWEDAAEPEVFKDESGISMQAGAFYSRRNAEKQTSKIEGLLTDAQVKVVHDGDMYKVMIDGISNKKEAAKYKKILSKEKISSYIIKE